MSVEREEGLLPMRLDVSGITDADCGTVDMLARMQLAAKRAGRTIELCGASDELRELLALSGLSNVLPCRESGSGFEMVREAEQREPARGVEEEGDPADPIA
jgi:anti-anti-sigma regulatory factor